MTLNLRARAPDAQIFGAEVERLAVIEGDGQRLAVLVQPQLRRPGRRRCVVHFDLLGADRRESRSRRRRAIARAEVEAEMGSAQTAEHRRRNVADPVYSAAVGEIQVRCQTPCPSPDLLLT